MPEAGRSAFAPWSPRFVEPQQYLLAELRRLAERQTIGEVLDRVETRLGGHVGLLQAVDDLAGERARG